jgi:hypothetical protein
MKILAYRFKYFHHGVHEGRMMMVFHCGHCIVLIVFMETTKLGVGACKLEVLSRAQDQDQEHQLNVNSTLGRHKTNIPPPECRVISFCLRPPPDAMQGKWALTIRCSG